MWATVVDIVLGGLNGFKSFFHGPHGSSIINKYMAIFNLSNEVIFDR